MRRIYVFLMFLLCLPMGCVREEQPANVVATVNDVPITLSTLEALQEVDMADVGIFEQFSLHELRRQYGKTLGSLVVYELIAQDLERRGLGISAQDVQKYEDDIRADYPEGEFEKYFEENALNMDAWRHVLRYNLAIQTFTQQVLRKDFVPSLDVVQKYYDKHKKRFMLEESFDLYMVTAKKREDLQNLKKTDDLLARLEGLEPTEMKMAYSEVPKAWQQKVYGLDDAQCTSIFKEEDLFTVLCLKDHWPARVLSADEAYVYIEEFLAEEELIFSFEKWLEQAVPAADISVSKHMVQDIH